jgi:hypothetical protein
MLTDAEHDQPMRLHAVLDDALALVERRAGLEAIERLSAGLNRVRRAANPSVWKEALCPECLSHPIRALLHQDPYTRRAFDKPRDYAGDAPMLDYIYSGVPPEDTTPIGRAVFEGTTRTSNGLSVLDRRDRLARWIDEEAARAPGLVILCIACGHLREAALSSAVATGAVSAFHAMDQDAASLAVAAASAPGVVKPLHAPLTRLIRGDLGLGGLDFIYAAGLFDYLNDRLASRTIERAWAMLAPAGRLTVANFTPESAGRAYMEAFMNWWLIYRSDQDMLGLIPEVVAAEASVTLETDAFGNIVYLKLRKKA